MRISNVLRAGTLEAAGSLSRIPLFSAAKRPGPQVYWCTGDPLNRSSLLEGNHHCSCNGL